MKYKAKLFGLYLPIFTLISVATVVIRSVSLFLEFDFKSGYFTKKTLISVADYLIVASVIFFLTYILTARKDITLIPDFTSPMTYIPTGLAGVAIAFLAVELFGKAAELYKSRSQLLLALIITIAAVLAVCSIVHFLFTALVEEHTNTRRANFGICTVLFLSLYVIYLYFSSEILFESHLPDSHLPINAPNKIVDQMAYLFAAVFFLYETRLSLGREKWRSYIAFGFIGALMCAYSSIPSIIIYFANGNIVSNSIYESALSFALFVFILSRLLLTGHLIENSESSTVSAIAAIANARELELNPIIETPEVIDISGEALETLEAEEGDENQITIDDLTREPDSINSVEDSAWESTEAEALHETDLEKSSESSQTINNALNSDEAAVQPSDKASANTTEDAE